MRANTLTSVAILVCLVVSLLGAEAEDRKKASIEGLVLSPQIGYAVFIHFRVEIRKGKWRKVATTDSKGRFEFLDLQPGVYVLNPEKTKPMCFQPLRTVKIRIIGDEVVHKDLEIKRADDYEENCVMDQAHP